MGKVFEMCNEIMPGMYPLVKRRKEMPNVIDCRAIAARIEENVKREVLQKRDAPPPTLAILYNGADEAQCSYVRSKVNACQRVGIHTILRETSLYTVHDYKQSIRSLNEMLRVTGIIVQLPLPAPLRAFTKSILAEIDPRKDVDGLTPTGKLFPCTPVAVMDILLSLKLPLAGKHAVVIGRSDLVGKPVAKLLTDADCTVTLCHSKTSQIWHHTERADILVTAAGRPNLITSEMVKPGAVVIDVGISRVDGRLCGDVDFQSVKEVAGYITPVPRGVGLVTVAEVVNNVFQLWKEAWK